MRFLVALCAVLTLGACATRPAGPPPAGTQAEVAALAEGIRAMSPAVDPQEADRAARIAFSYTHALAIAYQITDSPLVHNAKVNNGSRARGLCWHWAEDIERRLKEENFQTLDLHRAIANSDSRILIDHSTAVISAKGAPQSEGIVLDPWRKGGVLFWSPMQSDTRYTWKPREQVLREQGRIRFVDRYGQAAAPPAWATQ